MEIAWRARAFCMAIAGFAGRNSHGPGGTCGAARANQRGQAALTDSLYFLLIVSGLAAFLFFFAASYGQIVEQQVAREYRSEYATSALETILYSSTPRIAGQTLENASEVDYLLAAVKEDYADDRVLDETSAILAENISGIMQPFSDGFDYAFYIYLPDRMTFGSEEKHFTSKFAYAMFFVAGTEFEESGGKVTGVSFRMEKRDIVLGNTEKRILLCNPASLDDMDNLLAGVGQTAQSSAKIQMIEIAEGGAEKYPPAQVNLTMWLPAGMDLSKMDCVAHSPVAASA